MTRIIKFRAWNEREKKMRYDIMENFSKITDDGDNILMQFTGLLDILGDEIYEGDIAKQFFTEGEELMICVWGKTGFVWEGKNDGVSGKWSGKDFEIVGNIYENPELLTNKS